MNNRFAECRFFLYFLFLSDEVPMLETLDHTIRIGSTPTFLYFDLYLHCAYAVHYVCVFFSRFSTRRHFLREKIFLLFYELSIGTN